MLALKSKNVLSMCDLIPSYSSTPASQRLRCNKVLSSAELCGAIGVKADGRKDTSARRVILLTFVIQFSRWCTFDVIIHINSVTTRGL